MIIDKQSGTGDNPVFIPFANGKNQKMVFIALSINEENKEIVSGYSEAIHGQALGFLQEKKYDVSSAQYVYVLNAGENAKNSRVGFSVNVYYDEQESQEDIVEE